MEDNNLLTSTKECLKCHEIKHFSSFSSSKNGKYGLHNWCKKCVSDYNKEKYHEAPEAKIDKSRQWNLRNLGKINKYQRIHRRKKNPNLKEHNRIEIPDVEFNPSLDF